MSFSFALAVLRCYLICQYQFSFSWGKDINMQDKKIFGPSDQNGLYVEIFRIWVWYILLKAKSFALVWQKSLVLPFFWQSFERFCVHSLETVNLRKLREGWSICMDGLKCKERNNHSNHSSHAWNLIKLGTALEYTYSKIFLKCDQFILDGCLIWMVVFWMVVMNIIFILDLVYKFFYIFCESKQFWK